MRVLVIGGGGREHSLVWRLKQSPQNPEIFCAPGNAGMDDIATCVDIAATDVDLLIPHQANTRIINATGNRFTNALQVPSSVSTRQ